MPHYAGRNEQLGHLCNEIVIEAKLGIDAIGNSQFLDYFSFLG